MHMTRRGKISLSILGVLILGIASAIAYFDWNMVKPYAERRLSDASGRDVSLAGDVKVALSFTPKIHVEHVRIANPAWAKEKEMLDADAVDVVVDLRRWWVGEYYLQEVVLTRPKVALEVSPDGRRNWYLDSEQKDDGADGPPEGDRLGRNRPGLLLRSLAPGLSKKCLHPADGTCPRRQTSHHHSLPPF